MKIIRYHLVIRKIIFSLIACTTFWACDSDKEEIPTGTNPLKLEASGRVVELDIDNLDKEILSFTWEPAEDRSAEGTTLEEYLFKMDLAGKGFETAIPTSAITKGLYYKTFSSRELNDILFNQWGVTPGAEVGVEARVIARYSNPDKFVMPAVSTTSLRIQSKQISSQPLYLSGSANPAGTGLSDAIEMTEVLPGESYVWRGDLVAGEYFFIPQKDSEYPAYMMGIDENDSRIIYKSSAGESGKPFKIGTAGKYVISLNLTTKRIVCEKAFYVDKLSIIGSGTNWGWPSGSVGPEDAAYGGLLTWSNTNPHECEITTDLKAGEFRICIAGQSDAAFRPYNASAPVTVAEQDVVFMSKPDYKWKLAASEAGTYQIILDTKNYKIKILKK